MDYEEILQKQLPVDVEGLRPGESPLGYCVRYGWIVLKRDRAGRPYIELTDEGREALASDRATLN